jgi:hypothetical protein
MATADSSSTQPLEEWAQGIARGAVNPVIAAVVDAGLCRLADDVVHIVDVVVVVAGSAEHDVGAGITVQGVVTGAAQQRIVTGATVKVIAPAEARDGIGCRCASEIVVKFGADNVCHNPDLRGAQLGFAATRANELPLIKWDSELRLTVACTS